MGGATVTLAGAALAATTGPDGAYTLAAVPFGAHTAVMTAPGYATLSSAVTVEGAETLDFSPPAAADYAVGDGGDTCSAGYAWIDATGGTPHNLADEAYTSVCPLSAVHLLRREL